MLTSTIASNHKQLDNTLGTKASLVSIGSKRQWNHGIMELTWDNGAQEELDRKHYIAKVHNPLKESGLPFDVLPLTYITQSN